VVVCDRLQKPFMIGESCGWIWWLLLGGDCGDGFRCLRNALVIADGWLMQLHVSVGSGGVEADLARLTGHARRASMSSPIDIGNSK
jgi:hypothetical protein